MDEKRRIKLQEYIYIAFIVALPFSWASSIFGSLYRLLSIILVLIFVIMKAGRIPLLEENQGTRKAFFAYVVYVVLSMIWSANRSTGTNVILGMVLLLAIAYIFASYEYDKYISRLIDYSWITAGIIAAAVFLRGGAAGVGIYGSRTSLMILGTATDPNEFASLFVITIPLFLYYSINSKRLLIRVLSLVFALVELYAVLLTGSRGALFGVVLSSLVTIFICGAISMRGFLASLVGIIIGFWVLATYILPSLPGDIIQRLSIQAVLTDSGSGRTTIWKSGIEQWATGNPLRWIVGYGVDGLKAHGIRGDTGTMHNQILQQIIYYGLVGLVLYIRLIWKAFKDLVTSNKKYVGPFLGIMLVSLTVTMGPAYKPLWILIMMSFVKSREVSSTLKEEPCGEEAFYNNN